MRAIVLLPLLIACGDRCETACRDMANALQPCVCSSSAECALTWEDVGARNRNDFLEQCRLDWDAASGDLSSSELSLHLDACQQTSQSLEDLTCDEMVALYAPEP